MYVCVCERRSANENESGRVRELEGEVEEIGKVR